MSELVLVERAGGVATVTLNRPDALNAWTPQLGRDLLGVLQAVAADDGARAVVITGAGRAFSAGADVKNPRELLSDGSADLSTRLREIYNPIVLTVREMRKPVIAAVNGAAAGIGCSLALACDLIVAAESAYFLQAFVRLGVVPDAGGLHHLSARVGPARATELAMLGDRLAAARALEWGVVNRVVPDDQLAAAAGELAARLAEGPTVALGNIKRVLDGPAGADALHAQLEFEAALQQEHATTADYAEGVAAFKEKRRPRFAGR